MKASSRRPFRAAGIALGLAAGAVMAAGLVFAQDKDADRLSDEYEIFYALDPGAAMDALLDYDDDALANIDEAIILTDPFFWDTDRDGFSDLVDANPLSRAYFQWGSLAFTEGDYYHYASPDWVLGAYQSGGEWVIDMATSQSAWRVSSDEEKGAGSLNVDLDRSILTNNLRYAIRFEGRAAQLVQPSCLAEQARLPQPQFCVNLLDTNGMVIAENLYSNLLTGSNSDSIVLLDVPTAILPNASVIQLRCAGAPLVGARSETNLWSIIVYEGLLYIDEDGDGLDADQERQVGTSDHCADSNGDGVGDYIDCFSNMGSTNEPGHDADENGEGEIDPAPRHDDRGEIGVIYVDQGMGSDSFTGRARSIAAKKHGPKKTVRGGLSISEPSDTIIIRSGNYREDLNIRGRNVKVIIEGKVRL